MVGLQGFVFARGFSIVLKGNNDPVLVRPDAAPVYLHFVDGSDTTIVPTYEDAGLDTGSGAAAGFRIPVASTAELTALEAEVDALETYAVSGGRWDVSAVHQPGGDGEGYAAQFGEFVRTDLQNLGSGEAYTVTLPLVGSGDVGRRITVSEVWGSFVGDDGVSTGPELRIATSSGQLVDFGLTLPLSLVGHRPRIVLVAVELTSGVYGWSVESTSRGDILTP